MILFVVSYSKYLPKPIKVESSSMFEYIAEPPVLEQCKTYGDTRHPGAGSHDTSEVWDKLQIVLPPDLTVCRLP